MKLCLIVKHLFESDLFLKIGCLQSYSGYSKYNKETISGRCNLVMVLLLKELQSTAHPPSRCDRFTRDVRSLLRAQEGHHSPDFIRFANSGDGGKKIINTSRVEIRVLTHEREVNRTF